MLSPVGTAPLTTNAVYTNGGTTKNLSDSSGAQTIAHGLGAIPKSVKLTAIMSAGVASLSFDTALTVYNGTTQSSISTGLNSGTGNGEVVTTFTLYGANSAAVQTGVVTFDATNITITWTKTGSPTGTANILWEAVGPNS